MWVRKLSLATGRLEALKACRIKSSTWTLMFWSQAEVRVSFYWGFRGQKHGQEEASAREGEHCGHWGWQAGVGMWGILQTFSRVRRTNGIDIDYQSSRFSSYIKMSRQVTLNGQCFNSKMFAIRVLCLKYSSPCTIRVQGGCQLHCTHWSMRDWPRQLSSSTMLFPDFFFHQFSLKGSFWSPLLAISFSRITWSF